MSGDLWMSNKYSLFASTLLSSFMFFAPALAQDQVAAADDEATVEEVVVTGTRLRLPDYTLPNPVISTSAAQLEASGENNLTDFLQDLPALVSSVDDVFGADQATPSLVGLNLLNLRNLGTDRTLVLVNGRRHVSGDPGTAAVDINSIPTDLVERVDVQTGGSSAIYGADAVSGVVNFILKDDFEGLSTRTQVGAPEHGGGLTTFGSVLWGDNFADGRGNITVLGEYYNRDDVKFYDRDFTRPGRRQILVGNPAEVDQSSGPPGDIIDDPTVPDNILTRGATYIDTSPEGSIITRNDFLFRYLGDGRPFVQPTQTGSFIGIGGSGSLLDLYNDDLLPGVERYAVNMLGHFDVSDRMTVFAELKYVHSNSDFVGQPSYDYGLYVPIDSPLLPASAVADFNAAAATGDDIATELGLPPGVLIARDNFDLGSIAWDLARETTRGVVGLRGNITDNISYETSLNYGFSSQTQRGSNVRINERFFAATDIVTDPATGALTCRSNLDPTAVPFGDVFAQFPFDPATFGTTFTPGANSGCVPANIYGVGNLSQEAIDWINTNVVERSRISQLVWNGFISGTTENYFKIPTGGPVGFVFGAEYRREKSRYNPDPIELLSEQLQYPLTIAGRAATTIGEFSVAEAFTEVSLPLLTDKPFAKDLTMLGAYRFSDYSTAGETDTWNVGLRWAPNDSLMFRGTRARAVRAPNIVDLFQGRSQTFATFADPCDQANLGLGENPALRRQNCDIDLALAGYAPGTYQDTSSEALGGFIGGNPQLLSEDADTITYGVVFTPTVIPGFSMSLDYYEIKIVDAIQSFSAATIVRNCYDLPRPNDFCGLITRQGPGDPAPGRLSGFEQIPGNLATYKTSGYDISLRYRLDPRRYGVERDVGIFTLAVVGNALEDLVFTESSGAPPNEDDGERRETNEAAPEYQATVDLTWERGPWMVNYGFNWFSPTRRFSATQQRNEPDYVEPQYFKYKARHEHDLQVAYRFAEDKYEVYGGVNNFTDQEPEPDDYIYPVSPLGRYYYVGLKTRWK